MTTPLPAADHLHRRLVDFVGVVRDRGVSVGVGAEVDLARALEVLPEVHRGHFRDASVAVLAKSPEEARVVLQAFDDFFDAGPRRPGLPFTGQQSRASSAPTTLGRAGRTPKPDETDAPTGTTVFGSYSPDAPGAGHPLTPVPARELLDLRRGARRFRRRTATLPGRRRVRSRRGSVDALATVRRALGRGGEFVELVREAPRPGRAEFVILWDVSGSMREHDAELFALVYSLERVSRSARVFAFSTRVEEVTEEIRRNGYERATRAVATRLAAEAGGTRIGPCLQEFSDRFPGVLGDRSTLVVVSDGWDLAEPTALGEALRRLQRRSHRVVWVSPYARRPGFAPRTAGLVAALPFTDELLGPEDFRSQYPLRPIETEARTVPSAS